MRARAIAMVLGTVMAVGQVTTAQVPAPEALRTRVLSALVAAVRPALPYPDATSDDTAANGDTGALWVVRWPTTGDTEAGVAVVANTLNPENQARARAAEAEIQRAVLAVQQRTQNQYDRAVTEFARSGRVAMPVESPTLDDEGLAGARIDAGTRLTISVQVGEPRYRAEIRSSVPPAVSADIPGAAVVRVPENVYRDHAGSDGGDDIPHLHVAEARLWFGRVAPPIVTEERPGRHVVVVTAAGPLAGSAIAQNVAIHIEGNEGLVAHILQKADWRALAAIVAPMQ